MHGGIDQQVRADDEADEPADKQEAEGRDEDIDEEEGEADRDQGHAGPVDRDRAEPEEAEDQTEHADDAGQDRAGVGELEEDTERADREQQVGDRRIGDQLKESFEEVHLEGVDVRPCSVQGHRFAGIQGDLATIDIVEQGCQVGRHQVDHAELQRLVGGDVDGVAHRILGPVGIAAAVVGEVADLRHGIVGDLPVHRLVVHRVVATDRDGRGRADVGAGRHRGDVRGVGDVDPGRGRVRTARGDVGDDRDVAFEDAADDVVHRRAEPAGSVDFEHYRAGATILGAVNAAIDVAGHDRGDRAIDRDDLDGGLILGEDGRKDRKQHPKQDAQDRGGTQGDRAGGGVWWSGVPAIVARHGKSPVRIPSIAEN
jgi:hypothetical protein